MAHLAGCQEGGGGGAGGVCPRAAGQPVRAVLGVNALAGTEPGGRACCKEAVGCAFSAAGLLAELCLLRKHAACSYTGRLCWTRPRQSVLPPPTYPAPPSAPPPTPHVQLGRARGVCAAGGGGQRGAGCEGGARKQGVSGSRPLLMPSSRQPEQTAAGGLCDTYARAVAAQPCGACSWHRRLGCRRHAATVRVSCCAAHPNMIRLPLLFSSSFPRSVLPRSRSC